MVSGPWNSPTARNPLPATLTTSQQAARNGVKNGFRGGQLGERRAHRRRATTKGRVVKDRLYGSRARIGWGVVADVDTYAERADPLCVSQLAHLLLRNHDVGQTVQERTERRARPAVGDDHVHVRENC